MKKQFKYMLIIAWLGACGFLGLYLPKLPFVRELIDIDVVKIYGTKKINPQEVYKLFSNQNWFFLDENRIKKTLKETYPFIKGVEIQRLFTGEVRVVITERKPFAVVKQGKRKYILDSDGIVVRFYKTDEKLPYILYKDKDIDPKTLLAVLTLNRYLSKEFPLKRYIVKNGRIYFVSKGDKILVFDSLKLQEGLKKFNTLANKVKIQDYKYMNFCFDSMVVSRR